MYARRPTRPKPRSAEVKKWNAPTAGWISNRNLSDPQQMGEKQGAAILDNFFPRSSSVILRRGKVLYSTLGDGSLPCKSLFSYNNGPNQRLFAATLDTIYDISDGAAPVEVFSGLNGDNWIAVQFATTGGVYLIGVNGNDTGFIFDGQDFWPNVTGGVTRLNFDAQTANFTPGAVILGGTSAAFGTVYKVDDDGTTGTVYLTNVTGTFVDNEIISGGGGSATVDGVQDIAAPGVGFPSGLGSSDMSYVWVYKNRLWFVQKESLNAYYLDIDSIGGLAEIFPLAGVFGRGGSLSWGQTWSLEGGSSGGLSEQNIFVSTEGEVAIYQGSDPNEAATWAKVGVYRIGTPLGNRAFMRGGGDLAIATAVGLVPLSKAISLDVTSLNVATVSYNIADAWSDAVAQRGFDGWQCEIWPEQKLAAISPPNAIGSNDPVMFVSNTETGAWARYTNWYALCMEVYRGQLFFGSPDGKVFLANSSGFDDGEAYTGAVLPLFEDFGASVATKVAKVGRAVVRANTRINDAINWHSEYDLTMPPAPDAPVFALINTWDVGIWGISTWGSLTPSIISENWRSLGGLGYSCSVSFQVTSGAISPLDVELIRIEATYTTTEMIG